MKKVRVEVISQQGSCAYKHKVGDEWICGPTTPCGMCASMYVAIFPTIRALQAGGKFSWGKEDGSVEMCCTDHMNPLWVRLTPVD
jgi:uncharacterized repeat protein (TIGR04076 family)